MCDEFIHPGLVYDPPVSRRTFGLLGLAAAGIAGTAYAQGNVVEKDVEVRTADAAINSPVRCSRTLAGGFAAWRTCRMSSTGPNISSMFRRCSRSASVSMAAATAGSSR